MDMNNQMAIDILRNANLGGVLRQAADHAVKLLEAEKQGQWMKDETHGTPLWHCSVCKTLGSPRWKRCPVCEAKMEQVADKDLGEGP